jgi:chromosome segregation ATPase
MSKQIKKLEKETTSWRGKYEQTHTRLMKVTEEKLKSDTELGALLRKMTTLQNLCRTLQNQNVFMRTQIKELKGE